MIGIIVSFLISIVLYSVWYAARKQELRKKNNSPPALFEFPIVGSMIQALLAVGVASGQHYEKFHRLSKKYGPIACGKAGGMEVVLTEDYETVKQVLNSPDWANRFPNLPRFKEHILYKNLGLMWSDSEPHREMRRFIFRAFKAVGFGDPKQLEVFLQEELADLITQTDALIQKSPGNEICMQHFFKIPTFNIFWRAMAGYRFSYDDEKIKELILAVHNISTINIGLDAEWAFPILRFIPGLSPSRAKRQSFETCHQFFIDIMNERRKLKRYREVQNDLIDHLLKKIDEEKEAQPEIYCDEQFQITCVDLLFGGLDTTSTSLEFGILYITKYPEVQRKIQAEIDAVVGSNRLPSVTDRSKLRYSEATMLEALRWANIVPMNGRTASCDTTVGGYNVKKDTICALNTSVIHFSKELWGDPEAFRPERFLDESNNIINAEKVLAFGGGPRICVGYSMAKINWLAFFTTLLQNYTFEPSPFHPELSTAPVCGVANSVRKYYCVLKPRFDRLPSVDSSN